jgi:ABC-type uncharacterized transport system permease subunit
MPINYSSLLLIVSALLLLAMSAATFLAIRQRKAPSANIFTIIKFAVIAVLVFSATGIFAALTPTGENQILGLNMSFPVTIAACSWIILLLTCISFRWWQLHQVGMVIYPFAAVSFFWVTQNHMQRLVPIEQIWPLEAHIWLSLIAYGLLTITAVQAIFVIFRERNLKSHKTSGFIAGLPALTVMEKVMFQLSALSYIWLTLSLVTGLLFLENIFQQSLAHKTFLSILAWLLLSIFLIGHRVKGWRGINAARWILCAFVLLLFGFVGSKFVYEILLNF